MVTLYDTDGEAIMLTNDTVYGLSMAVISSDIGGVLKLSRRLRTGPLYINDQTVNDEIVNPFGGAGDSETARPLAALPTGRIYTVAMADRQGEAPA